MRKHTGVFIGSLLLLAIIIQFGLYINDYLAPSSSKWSREIESSIPSQKISELQAVQDENTIYISTTTQDNVALYTCTTTYECDKDVTLNDITTKIPPHLTSTGLIYLQNDQLILQKWDKTKEVIDENVQQFEGNSDWLAYERTDQWFFMNVSSNEKWNEQFEDDVVGIATSEQSLYVTTKNKTTSVFTIYELNSTSHQIKSFSLDPSYILREMEIVQSSNGTDMIIQFEQYSQGERSTKVMFTDLNSSDETLQLVKFNEKDSTIPFRSVSHLHMKPNGTITFIGYRYNDKHILRPTVYEGQFDSGKVETQAVSKTQFTYIAPTQLDHSAVYMTTDGEKQSIYYSIERKEGMSKFDSLRLEDVKQAFYNDVTDSVKGIMFIFVALAWIVPTVLVYYILFHRMEAKQQVASSRNLALLLLSMSIVLAFIQYFVMSYVFHSEISLVMYLLISLIPFGLYLIKSRFEVEEMKQDMFVLVITNTLLLTILLGPYFY